MIDCLVREKLDIKYYVNLWVNELKGIYYGGDYHTGNLDAKVKQFVCYFHCLLSAIVWSILVLLWVIRCTKVRWVGGVQRVVVVCQIILTPFPFPSNDLTKYVSL